MDKDDRFLHYVAARRDLEIFNWLLSEKRVSPDNFLDAAYACGNYDALAILFDLGADHTFRLYGDEDECSGELAFMQLSLQKREVSNEQLFSLLEKWISFGAGRDVFAIIELFVEEASARVARSLLVIDEDKLNVLMSAIELAKKFKLESMRTKIERLISASMRLDGDFAHQNRN